MDRQGGERTFNHPDGGTLRFPQLTVVPTPLRICKIVVLLDPHWSPSASILGSEELAAPCRGRLRIRAKSTHKPGDGAARARLMISPTIPRLAWPAILAWI